MSFFKRKAINFEDAAVQQRVLKFQRALYLLLREFPNVTAKIQSLFAENDTDGDGVMDLNEFKKVRRASKYDLAEDNAAALKARICATPGRSFRCRVYVLACSLRPHAAFNAPCSPRTVRRCDGRGLDWPRAAAADPALP